MTFTLAIVGRPNVGKSTLFNRLIGKRLALVDDTPGVTRDRREGDGRLADLRFRVIDTAGLEEAPAESLADRMRKQTDRAIDEADVALFLIDARIGITPADRGFARELRRSGKPVILIANKCEGAAGANGLAEAYELGLGEPVGISAEHGENLSELYDLLRPYAEADEPEEGEELSDEDAEEGRGPLALAVVGRPNVGKSTMINRLLGEDRMLTGPEAGITRDSIAVPFEYKERAIRLVDTAGIRRRSRVEAKLEKLSVAESLRAIRYAEVVVLVIDAAFGLEKQDLAIAGTVIEEGRALIIAANKWDAVTDREGAMRAITDRLQTSLPQVRGIPVVTTSGLKGRNLDGMMEAVFAISAIWNKRLGTAEVNRWLTDATDQHPPPLVSGRRVKIRYATQVKARPPTFALFSSKPQELPDSYVRYLVNSLRDAFGLDGVPVRIVLRKRRNPSSTTEVVDPTALLLALLSIFLISFVKGAFGGGFAIVGIPLLSLVMNPLQAGALLAPLFVLMDLLALRYWKPSTWSKPDLAVLLPSMLVGLGLGFLILSSVDQHAVSIAIALITLIFAGLWFLGGSKIETRPRSLPRGLVAGFAAGVTTMVAHAGGPPLAMYLLPLGLAKALYAGTTSLFFTVTNLFKVGPWLVISWPSHEIWLIMFFCIPAVPLGIWLGWRFHQRLDQKQLYRACYGLLVATGLKLLWDGVSGYVGS